MPRERGIREGVGGRVPERWLVPVPREVVHRRVEVEQVVQERMGEDGVPALAADRREVAAHDEAGARGSAVAELPRDVGPGTLIFLVGVSGRGQDVARPRLVRDELALGESLLGTLQREAHARDADGLLQGVRGVGELRVGGRPQVDDAVAEQRERQRFEVLVVEPETAAVPVVPEDRERIVRVGGVGGFDKIFSSPHPHPIQRSAGSRG
jgi:hypothetical protein